MGCRRQPAAIGSWLGPAHVIEIKHQDVGAGGRCLPGRRTGSGLEDETKKAEENQKTHGGAETRWCRQSIAGWMKRAALLFRQVIAALSVICAPLSVE